MLYIDAQHMNESTGVMEDPDKNTEVYAEVYHTKTRYWLIIHS